MVISKPDRKIRTVINPFHVGLNFSKLSFAIFPRNHIIFIVEKPQKLRFNCSDMMAHVCLTDPTEHENGFCRERLVF